MNSRWDAAVNDVEHRLDRPVGPSTVLHPNGSCICSGDGAFLVAITRRVLELRTQEAP